MKHTLKIGDDSVMLSASYLPNPHMAKWSLVVSHAEGGTVVYEVTAFRGEWMRQAFDYAEAPGEVLDAVAKLFEAMNRCTYTKNLLANEPYNIDTAISEALKEISK